MATVQNPGKAPSILGRGCSSKISMEHLRGISQGVDEIDFKILKGSIQKRTCRLIITRRKLISISSISTSLTVPGQPSPRFHVEAWLPFRNREMELFFNVNLALNTHVTLRIEHTCFSRIFASFH